MGKSGRRSELILLLGEQGVMAVSDLARRLGTSMMTIRRDLRELEQEGAIKKVHGGAMLRKRDAEQSPFRDRVGSFKEEKSRIGRAAAQLIKEGDIVFFDAGTTPYSIVEHLPDGIRFTAITIGLMTAVALCEKPKVDILSIGGNVHHSSYSVMSYVAADAIRQLRADLAFVSTEAVSVAEGAFDSQLPLIEIKKAMVEVSRKAVLLVDHSKFEAMSLCLSLPLDAFQTVITDSGTDPEAIRTLREKGIEAIVAE